MGDGRKQKKNRQYDPVSGVDGGDVIGATMPKREAKREHAHPGMSRNCSSQPDSPPSRPDSPLSNTDGEAVTQKRKAKRSPPRGHAHLGMWRKRSSRPDSPSSNTDGKAQAAGEPWATPKSKKGKSIVHKSQMKEENTSVPFQGTDGGDVAVLPGVPGEETARSKQQRKHSSAGKKKGKDIVHRGQLKEDVKAALHGFPGEEATARSKQRSDQPSGSHDGKTQAPGQASAAPSRKKKKRNNRLLHNALLMQDGKAQLMEEGSAYLMPGSNDIVVMPKQKKNITGLSDPPANHSCSNAQRAGKASADAGKEKNMLMGEKVHKILRPSRLRGVTINTAEGDEPANLIDCINKHDTEVEGEESTVVGNCLHGNLLVDRSIPPASHSGSKSEESTWTQQKKPNIQNPATGEKILLDDKQEQRAGQIQYLLDLDDDTALDQIVSYSRQLRTGPPKDDAFWDEYDEWQLVEVYQRLALHRIKDHELLLTGKELDVAELKDKYELAILQDEGYFQRYEKNLEWYFDPELCQRASLNDYQRLVIHNDGSYANWHYYRLTYHTYEGDEEYVRFCDEMSNAIKWVDNKVGLDKHQWEKYECRAYLQALKIATGYHNIFRAAAIEGFNEYILNLLSDFEKRKDLDGVYLEIWKRVAKDKMEFNSAVKEIYKQNMFPSRNYDIKLAMENYPFKFRASIKDNYDAYVACIDGKTSEDEAHRLIIEAVKKMVPKGKKSYLDYARKKMEIAERIGLSSKSTNGLDGI